LVLWVFPFGGVFIERDNRDSTVVDQIWRVDVVGWEGEESLLIIAVQS
jgi:hypothetical protein